ncbi:PREDICTED: uncharacterized protein LOC109351676 [Lupinus angustifolius]|uniref:uncharacterized protein LOC109351676 n=1 Tax=Lupinus angustifolius TaxID=3871 RepID=UPI00092F8208|nr:PREDICTED: uncharacterized protein LOC109351676 [Lupinus angustifolius]
MVDMHLDVYATVVTDYNGNMIVDTGPFKQSGGDQRVMFQKDKDVERNQRKLINIVDKPSSKSEGEQLSTGIKEAKSGDPVDMYKMQRMLQKLKKDFLKQLLIQLPEEVKKMLTTDKVHSWLLI